MTDGPRDGRELFYAAADFQLMAVDVKEGPGSGEFQAGPHKALFQTHPPLIEIGPLRVYTASPNGRRFLVNSSLGAEAPAPITVVINWAAGLKR